MSYKKGHSFVKIDDRRLLIGGIVKSLKYQRYYLRLLYVYDKSNGESNISFSRVSNPTKTIVPRKKRLPGLHVNCRKLKSVRSTMQRICDAFGPCLSDDCRAISKYSSSLSARNLTMSFGGAAFSRPHTSNPANGNTMTGEPSLS